MAGNINNSFFAQFQKARSDMKAEFNKFKQQISGTGETQQADGQNTAILGNRQQANAEFANNIRNAKWEQMDAQMMEMPDMMQNVHQTTGGEQTITLQHADSGVETGSVGPQYTSDGEQTITLQHADSGVETGSVGPQYTSDGEQTVTLQHADSGVETGSVGPQYAPGGADITAMKQASKMFQAQQAPEAGSAGPQVAPQPNDSTLTLEDGTVIQAKVFSDDNPT